MTALAMTGACSSSADDAMPPVPAGLIEPAEIPWGDAVSARMTRAAHAVRTAMEPRWGALDGRLYLLPADRLSGFGAATPPGWQKDTSIPVPDGARLITLTNGRHIAAYLLLDRQMDGHYPVQIFHDRRD